MSAIAAAATTAGWVATAIALVFAAAAVACLFALKPGGRRSRKARLEYAKAHDFSYLEDAVYPELQAIALPSMPVMNKLTGAVSGQVAGHPLVIAEVRGGDRNGLRKHQVLALDLGSQFLGVDVSAITVPLIARQRRSLPPFERAFTVTGPPGPRVTVPDQIKAIMLGCPSRSLRVAGRWLIFSYTGFSAVDWDREVADLVHVARAIPDEWVDSAAPAADAGNLRPLVSSSRWKAH